MIGVDSGPLHLAAALAKPGVAIFGPTNPARHGPYGGTMRTLRVPGAVDDYSRRAAPHATILAISPGMVAEALTSVGCPA